MTRINIQRREKETKVKLSIKKIALVIYRIMKKKIISHSLRNKKNKNRLKPSMGEKFQNFKISKFQLFDI